MCWVLRETGGAGESEKHQDHDVRGSGAVHSGSDGHIKVRAGSESVAAFSARIALPTNAHLAPPRKCIWGGGGDMARRSAGSACGTDIACRQEEANPWSPSRQNSAPLLIMPATCSCSFSASCLHADALAQPSQLAAGEYTTAIMSARSALLAALVAALCVASSDALYIKVAQNKPKCFIEELHKDEVVIVHYKSPDQAKLPHGAAEQKYHVGLRLDVTQGTHKVFDGRADTEGRFAFTALQGEHHLCWSIEGNSLGQDFRVHMDFKVGNSDVDYDQVAKKEHLSALELRIRKLKDDVNKIISDQWYFRQREERSKMTSDSTFFRAMWLSILQIVGMMGVTGAYLFYLRRYFIQKKLV